MASLADMATSFGIPVAAASIAGSIYWALSKAEKVARPEALKEISAVLKDASWSQSVKPWSIVESLFVWTFGEKHFSLKCITRSAISTVIMVTSLLTLHVVSTGDSRILLFIKYPYGFIPFAILTAFAPDYFALLKTRALLKGGDKYPTIFTLCLDAASSTAITVVFLVLNALLSSLGIVSQSRLAMAIHFINPVTEFQELVAISNSSLPTTFYAAFYFSTLFTSIWLALIVISTTLLKLLAPLQRFTSWFFDVEKHPLEAVGIVTGTLVMLAAAIGTVIQRL